MNLLRASAFLMTLLASAGFAADVPAQTLVSAKAIYTMDASQKQVQAFVFDSDGALLATKDMRSSLDKGNSSKKQQRTCALHSIKTQRPKKRRVLVS
jgi:hypothetical protein